MNRARKTVLLTAERLSWLPAWLILAFSGYALLMALDRAAPMVYLKGSQRAEWYGETVLIEYGIERRRLCNTRVYRSVIDPAGYLRHLEPMRYTPEQIGELQEVSPGRVSMLLPMPPNPLPGEYRLQVAVDYSCNWVQEFVPIRVSFSVPFRR